MLILVLFNLQVVKHCFVLALEEVEMILRFQNMLLVYNNNLTKKSLDVFNVDFAGAAWVELIYKLLLFVVFTVQGFAKNLE